MKLISITHGYVLQQELVSVEINYKNIKQTSFNVRKSDILSHGDLVTKEVTLPSPNQDLRH